MNPFRPLQRLFFLSCVVSTTSVALGQGQIATGTLSSSGAGPYSYLLTFSDAAGATSPIGSVWYAWVPGSFYLPAVPTSASSPAGWTATISANSIQYVANSAANDILPGHTLSGFGYLANFTPAQLNAAPNSGVSVAYSGGLFSDGGYTFTVTQAVPEPSALGLLVIGCGLLTRFRGKRAE
ncbi:MAG TPA: PEP-CTERM sorting domain-containing protein [Verrucomicrobiae bacterium]|nr:PEP-CTERM sorting domain-containing protein [Verrucomicrobiae bacterium]